MENQVTFLERYSAEQEAVASTLDADLRDMLRQQARDEVDKIALNDEVTRKEAELKVNIHLFLSFAC